MSIQLTAKQYNVLRKATVKNPVAPISGGINFKNKHATSSDFNTFVSLFVGEVANEEKILYFCLIHLLPKGRGLLKFTL